MRRQRVAYVGVERTVDEFLRTTVVGPARHDIGARVHARRRRAAGVQVSKQHGSSGKSRGGVGGIASDCMFKAYRRVRVGRARQVVVGREIGDVAVFVGGGG